ncbi:hypothetical protein [Tautonia sociabilis]|uniref:DUF2007 domain-containing protein n=1 Tax=Tautonia sociabilis TaxID=2080755 RepID=A0A432MRC5_9BACT|nr:hypothetical protein [Tautonia sociabilis]RUL89526.1 hypothetical protein TsocGM_01785 [Tautonia sociabilis]
MEPPMIRPGQTPETQEVPRLVAFFRNSAQGNLAIQLLIGQGVPSDRLGVTGPDRIEGHQGMILSIPIPDASAADRLASLCRKLGAEVHRQRP